MGSEKGRCHSAYGGETAGRGTCLVCSIDCFNEYVSYEAWEDDQVISQGTVIFSYPKYFHYLDPKLTVRTEGDEIIVSASAYAKSVEILNDTEDLILEDNYFDMNAGERRIKILQGKPEGLRVRSVYDI